MALGKLAKFLKPYTWQCIVGPLAKLAEAVLELYLPLLMARVIDEGVAKGDTGYILRMGGAMLGIVTVGLLWFASMSPRSPRRASAPSCATPCSGGYPLFPTRSWTVSGLPP